MHAQAVGVMFKVINYSMSFSFPYDEYAKIILQPSNLCKKHVCNGMLKIFLS